MVYGEPLWLCVTALSRQPLRIGPAAGDVPRDAGHEVVRRVGAGRPAVGLGIDAVLRREPVVEHDPRHFENVYDAVRVSGVVR